MDNQELEQQQIIEQIEEQKMDQPDSVPQEEQTKDAGKEKNKTDLRTNILTTLHDLAFVLAGMLLVLLLIFRVVIVSGPSMNATLVNGDYILLLGNVFYTQPEQGDIIVRSNGKELSFETSK